jgi:hypothetical protein
MILLILFGQSYIANVDPSLSSFEEAFIDAYSRR